MVKGDRTAFGPKENAQTKEIPCCYPSLSAGSVLISGRHRHSDGCL